MGAIIDSLTTVFSAVFEWIMGAIEAVIPVFWNATADGGTLTFLGVLAIIALAISIFFLIVGFIQNFLHLRG